MISVTKTDACREDQGEGADQRINTDLGHQPGEDRGDRDRRGVVARRQPEEERENSRLDAERDQKQDRDNTQQPLVIEAAEPPVQVGHVEGAGEAVEKADGGQEEDSGDQVDRDIFDSTIELTPITAERHQGEGGDQHHLEPDIEIEEIAGEKGAGHAGE